MRSQRILELERQKEIIELWLHTPGIPADAHARLSDMLTEVNQEMDRLATFDTGVRDHERGWKRGPRILSRSNGA